jgi:SRSO17 transposase
MRGNLGKVDNGIRVVLIYGVFCGMTFPLMFDVYKPRERLKPEDKYRTKPQIAAAMIRELQAMGFRFNKRFSRRLGRKQKKLCSSIK